MLLTISAVIALICIFLGPYKGSALAMTLLLIYLHPYTALGILVLATFVFYLFKHRSNTYAKLSKLFNRRD